jgi:vancomycin permeability regulator SanA
MKKIFSQIFHNVLMVIVVDLAVTALWGWGTTRYFREHPMARAPTAAVLMDNFDVRTGTLTPETLRRLNQALGLYHEGSVEYVLCAGGARPRLNVYGSEFMRQYLIDAGIPEERIFLEKTSYDSKTNWAAILQIIANYGGDKVVLVSSPFHLYRFRQVIRDGPPHYLKVFYSPYSLKEAKPPATYWDMWAQIHYQWVAHYSQLLPEKIYKKVIDRLRAQ